MTPSPTTADRQPDAPPGQAGYAWAAVAAVSFSFEGLFARVAFGAGATPYAALAGRYIMAAVLMALAVTFALRVRAHGRRLLPSARIARRDLWALVASGAVGYFGTSALLFVAFQHIPTSLAILLLYTYPALVALGGHFLGREHLTLAHIGALLLTFAGVALVGGADLNLDLVGVLAAEAAAVVNAGTLLFQQPFLERVDAYRATLLAVAGAALSAFVLMWLTGDAQFPPMGSWLPIIGLAALPSLLALLSISRGLQLIGASRTAIVATMEPAFAAVWGAVWLGEALGWLQLGGGLAILAGVTLVQLIPPAAHAPRSAG